MATVRYYGVDDMSLTKRSPAFEHPEKMSFVDGDHLTLSRIEASFDFGLVDACHCSECVFHDSIAMSRKIAVGGLMAFHDTSMMSQFPHSPIGWTTWQHYGRGHESERPLAVLEGIVMARHLWLGEWKLVIQEGDHLEWGGVRVYEKVS